MTTAATGTTKANECRDSDEARNSCHNWDRDRGVCRDHDRDHCREWDRDRDFCRDEIPAPVVIVEPAPVVIEPAPVVVVDPTPMPDPAPAPVIDDHSHDFNHYSWMSGDSVYHNGDVALYCFSIDNSSYVMGGARTTTPA